MAKIAALSVMLVLLTLGVAMVGAATVTVYTDKTEWENALGGQFLTVRELAEIAAAVTGVPVPRITFPAGLVRAGAPFLGAWARITGCQPLYTAESLDALERGGRVDIAKAERELGYSTRPIRTTVEDLYRWFEGTGRIPAGTVRPGDPA